jgi:hypothetical protein
VQLAAEPDERNPGYHDHDDRQRCLITEDGKQHEEREHGQPEARP